MKLPRGIRNNNPGNIKHVEANKWQGLSNPPHDEDGFCVFDSPIDGIRAAALLLINYQDKHGLDTIALLVSRWAPEEDPVSYVRYVVGRTGFSSNEPLDLHKHEHLRPLLEAIMDYETGVTGPYSKAVVDAALTRAGVPPPAPAVAVTKEGVGAQLAGLGGLLTLAEGAIKDALATVQPLIQYIDEFKYVVAALTIIGAGLTIYGKLKAQPMGR